MTLLLVCAVTFVATLVFGSIFEWTLHRYVMHRPVGNSKIGRYAHTAHTLVHHHKFKGDSSYHLDGHEEDKEYISMAWWNSIAITFGGVIPHAIVSWHIGYIKPIMWTGVVTVFCYYLVYESIHWCMHRPRETRRFFERIFLPFKWLNGHHILHHRYMDNNLNVVFPLADWMFGTLLLRSRMRFDQPRGPLVPDVQPLDGRPRSAILEFMQ